MEEVSKRNFMAIQQAINLLEARSQDQQVALQTLQASITQLSMQATRLEQLMSILQAKNLIYGGGHGPTVR
jgi:peptidase E